MNDIETVRNALNASDDTLSALERIENKIEQLEGLLREAAAKTLSSREAAKTLREAWRKSARRAEEFATQSPTTNEQWRAFGAMETSYAYADELDPDVV